MPFEQKAPNHVSKITRAYTHQTAADWWQTLTPEQRGKIIEHVMRNNAEYLDELTWKKVD
jgi:hypothetical protein